MANNNDDRCGERARQRPRLALLPNWRARAVHEPARDFLLAFLSDQPRVLHTLASSSKDWKLLLDTKLAEVNMPLTNQDILSPTSLPFLGANLTRIDVTKKPVRVHIEGEGWATYMTYNFTDLGLLMVAARCPNLETLAARNCPRICTSIAGLGKMLPKLQVLDLRIDNSARMAATDGVDDDAFVVLLHNAPTLRAVLLSNTPQLTSEGLLRAARDAKPQKLKQLVLERTPNIGGASFTSSVMPGIVVDGAQAVAAAHNAFAALSSVENCPALSIVGLAKNRQFSRRQPQAQGQAAPRVGFDFMGGFASGMGKRLVQLDLGCCLIVPREEEAILDRCLALRGWFRQRASYAGRLFDDEKYDKAEQHAVLVVREVTSMRPKVVRRSRPSFYRAKARVILGRLAQGGRMTGGDTTAWRFFKKAQEEGLRDANYELGMYANRGIGFAGIKLDYREAFCCFFRAAARSHYQAQWELGRMLLKGHGCTAAYGRALYWFKEAAKGGRQGIGAVAAANFSIASMYLTPSAADDGLRYTGPPFFRRFGREPSTLWPGYVAGDHQNLARGWLHLGSERGDVRSKYCLATMYLDTPFYDLGPLVLLPAAPNPTNMPTTEQEAHAFAYDLLREAVDLDFSNGPSNSSLGFCLLRGIGVNQDVAQSIIYLSRAARYKNPPAMLQMACCYEQGLGVVANNETACMWLRRLERLDLVAFRVASDEHTAVVRDARFKLAMHYSAGTGVAKDPVKASELLLLGAGYHHTASLFELGSMYDDGVGVPKDEGRARACYHMAAVNGHRDAQYNIACCCLEGIGGPPNFPQALEWFVKSAEQGCVDAMFNAGVCYFKGRGTIQDRERAYFFFKQVRDHNVDPVLTNKADVMMRACGPQFTFA